MTPDSPMSLVAERLLNVRAEIAEVCHEAGRDPETVRLLPVSKLHPAEAVEQAYQAGARMFAENRPQELAAKAQALSGLPDLRWAAIGHLQTNKAKLVAEHASEFHALDSLKVAEALDRQLQRLGRELDVFIQVNAAQEETKHGLEVRQVPGFADQLRSCDSLRVVGLMTIGAHTQDPARIDASFAAVAQLQRQLRDSGAPGSFDELSMGMSGDFASAIRHGSTVIRIGTAIFGRRL